MRHLQFAAAIAIALAANSTAADYDEMSCTHPMAQSDWNCRDNDNDSIINCMDPCPDDPDPECVGVPTVISVGDGTNTPPPPGFDSFDQFCSQYPGTPGCGNSQPGGGDSDGDNGDNGGSGGNGGGGNGGDGGDSDGDSDGQNQPLIDQAGQPFVPDDALNAQARDLLSGSRVWKPELGEYVLYLEKSKFYWMPLPSGGGMGFYLKGAPQILQNAVRVQPPGTGSQGLNPYGYFVVYNAQGQRISFYSGRTVSTADSHYPLAFIAEE